MNIAVSPVDFALVALLLGSLPLDSWLTARLRRNIEAGAPGLRTRAYAMLIALQWLSCFIVLGWWFAAGRPWGAMLLGPVEPWRIAAGAVAAALCLVPVLRMRRRVFKAVAERGADKVKFGNSGSLEWLIPHTPAERVWWTVCSFTAGVCEEVVFRGFLLAFVAHFAGIIAAVPISALIFGLGHAYQGKNGILTTGIWGLTAGIIAIATGSLLPVIVLHMLQDLLAGDLGYRIVSARTMTSAA